MPIISLIIVLVVVGVILWLVNTYLPMDPIIKKIINIVVIIAVILWLLSALGIFAGMGMGSMHLGALPTAPPISLLV